MDKADITKALAKVRETSEKRKFDQSIDLIVNFKDLDLKKPDNQADFFASLHYSRGKKTKVCALIGPEMQAAAKAACDNVVLLDEFPQYAQNKKLTKKLANEYDFFIAQASLMPDVAKVFGKSLGPKNKMPNPKAGCVVPPNANLKPLVEKLSNTVRVSVKTQLSFKCRVGVESQKDEELADNIFTLYGQIIHHMPNEQNNIRSVLIKTTMGAPVKIRGGE